MSAQRNDIHIVMSGNREMPYTFKASQSPAFTGIGMEGYSFGPLRQQDLEMYLIESEKGHDTFVISKKITRTYYVLSGSGEFTIDGQRYDVCPGMLVEVPPKVEYTYSGKMTLIGLARPRWFRGNEMHTKWNPAVTHRDIFVGQHDQDGCLARLAKLTIAGRSPVGAYMRMNRRLWNHLPPWLASLRAVRSYGNFVHALARMRGGREQAPNTHFLRNRPQLELIRRLLASRTSSEIVRVAVLGCSTGPEAYSVAWRIHSARPDLRLDLSALDISPHAVKIARGGTYSASSCVDAGGSDVFIRMTAHEREQFFDWDGEIATVKPWIREGITWRVGDAGEPETAKALWPQDIVIANNFLCHMPPSEAERSLRNIAGMISPTGCLFVSGVDLAVRAKIALELKWEPIQDLLEEIHDGDHILRMFWPWDYTGLEPLDKKRPDWRIRYAAAFRVGPKGAHVS